MNRSLKRNSAFLIRMLLLLCVFLLPLARPVSAANSSDCSQTTPPTCAYVPQGTTVSVLPTAFSFPATYNNINLPDCQQVSDSCGSDLMVPIGSAGEWGSFLTSNLVTSTNTCVALSNCSLIVTLTAGQTSVAQGSSTTLTWAINDNVAAVACTPSSTDGSVWVPPTGDSLPIKWPAPGMGTPAYQTATVTPNPQNNGTSTTYTLNCTDGTNVGSGSVTVNVATSSGCASATVMQNSDIGNIQIFVLGSGVCPSSGDSSAPVGTMCYISYTDTDNNITYPCVVGGTLSQCPKIVHATAAAECENGTGNNPTPTWVVLAGLSVNVTSAPPHQVLPNTPIELSWGVAGSSGVVNCSGSSSDGQWSGSSTGDVTSNANVMPTGAGTTYTVTCTDEINDVATSSTYIPVETMP